MNIKDQLFDTPDYSTEHPAGPGALSTQKTLLLIGLAGLATLLLAFAPGLGLINYAFRLLITMVHELGHGLAALLTGGQFRRFLVAPDGSGLAYTAGGWRLVIVPAGYLGAALFGAVLIRLGRNQRWGRLTLGLIGAMILGLSLRYGAPTIFTANLVSGLLTTISGLIFGGLFLWIAFSARPAWIVFWIHLIAIQAGLTACSDLMGLIGLSTRFFNATPNDAQSMAQLTFIPAVVWAVLWAVIAAVLIGGAIWLTWIGPALARRRN